MKPLNVNPEYKTLVPRPNEDEYKALEQSIIEKGEATEPIIVNRDNVILDGYTRYEICTKHGCFYKIDVRTFDSVFDEKIYVVESNILRRHLSTIQKAQLAIILEPLYIEKAKQRQLSKLTNVKETLSLSSNELTPEFEGQARDQVAKAVGISPTTYHRAKTVLKKAPEKLKKQVETGEKSVSKAYKEIITAEKKQTPVKTPPLPEGKYNIIYADPPWRYDFSETETRSIETHYPSMDLKDITSLSADGESIKDKITDDAVLFLWATNPKLEEAFDVIFSWGFEYKTNLVWVKDKIGMGYWVRGQHELLLIATKGDFPPPEPSIRCSSVLEAPRQEHSAKPVEVYEMIESYFPDGKYLELFSRTKREGWTMWGHIIDS